MSTMVREGLSGSQPAAMTHVAALEPVPLANAAAAVAAAGYLLCALVSILAPELLITFFRPWFHGFALEALRPAGAWFQLSDFVSGLITFTATTWLALAAFAWLYNAWVRRTQA